MERTGTDAVLHITAYICGQLNRKVTVGPVGAYLVHRGMQVHPAGALAGQRLPLRLQLTLQVLVADLRLDLHAGQLPVLQLPASFRRELLELDLFFLKHTRPGDPASLVDPYLGLPALWRPLSLELRALHAMPAGLCAGLALHVQLFGVDLALQTVRGIDRPLPLQTQ